MSEIRLDDCVLDLERGVIRRGSDENHISPRAIEVLRDLVTAHGEVVLTDKLLEHHWRAEVSPPNAVHKVITELRHALGDDPREPRFIETIPKRGYRLKVQTSVPAGRNPDEAQRRKNRTRLFLVGVLSIFLLAAISWRYQQSDDPPPRTAIAVLPFQNLSDSVELKYLADGLAEELINAFAGVQGLSVLSRQSSFQFGSDPIDAEKIAEALGVDAFVEGSVRKSDDRLRVSVRLVSADGRALWAPDPFERPLDDVFAIQDDIVARTIAALDLVIEGNRFVSAIDRTGTQNAEAYLLYLKGRESYWTTSIKGTREAVSLFDAAIAEDPDFHMAYGGLTRALWRLTQLDYPRRTDYAERLRAISAVVESRTSVWLDRPGGWVPSYHLNLARWDFPAVEELLRGQIINGSKPGPYQDPETEYALLLMMHGFPTDALQYLDRFADPDSFRTKVIRRTAVLNTGRVQEALAMEGRSWVTAELLIRLGRLDQAELALVDASMDDTMVRMTWWRLRFEQGDYENARQILESTIEHDSWLMGVVYHVRGEHDAGFVVWRKAARARDPYADRFYIGGPSTLWRVFPRIQPDPRFEEIARAIGYGREWRRELCHRASSLTTVTGISVNCFDDLKASMP
jgi:transcriptional activator of cad operon